MTLGIGCCKFLAIKMKLRTFLSALASIAIVSLFAACGGGDNHDHHGHDHHDHDHGHAHQSEAPDLTSFKKLPDGQKPVVVVPIPPYTGVVKRLAGDAVEIETLAGPGDDPHFFSPTPKQVARVNGASVYFTVGMPFEMEILEALKDSAPDLKVVDLTRGLEMLEADHTGHDHGDDHDHGHESDPHVWLAPEMLMKQAHTMHEVLEALLGEDHSGTVHENSDGLNSDLAILHRELQSKLADSKGEAFYVYHGAFAYFAKSYGLEQKAIQMGGKSPEPKKLTGIIEQAKKEGVKTIFVQPQFDQSSAKAIAEAIGGTVVSINPLAEDYVKNLKEIADAIIAK